MIHLVLSLSGLLSTHSNPFTTSVMAGGRQSFLSPRWQTELCKLQRSQRGGNLLQRRSVPTAWFVAMRSQSLDSAFRPTWVLRATFSNYRKEKGRWRPEELWVVFEELLITTVRSLIHQTQKRNYPSSFQLSFKNVSRGKSGPFYIFLF